MLKRLCLSIIITVFMAQVCFAALAIGTNAGFVSSAPSADPSGGGGAVTIDGYDIATKDTSPAGNNQITSIGWWVDAVATDGNYEVGIYSHDATNDKPNLILAVARTNAVGSSGGVWKNGTVSYTLTASTAYWVAVQTDAVTGNTQTDRSATAVGRQSYYSGSSTLPDSWQATSTESTRIYAIYAVYSAVTSTRRIMIID